MTKKTKKKLNIKYVDSYFDRIGYKGIKDSKLSVLTEIQYNHVKTIPFENLDLLLGKQISLNFSNIHNKLVYSGRGGYCYEQNLLLSYVLKQIGFTVKYIAARMMWKVPEHEITPRTHMLLLVDIDGEWWISDVGFGGGTPTSPIKFQPDVVQKTNHEPYRILYTEGYFTVQAYIRNNWISLYKFDLQEQYIVDYELLNWYLNNHPESHFKKGLLVSRADDGQRYALFNNKLSIHNLTKGTEKKYIDSSLKLKKILKTNFKLTLPKNESLNDVLNKLISDNGVDF